MTSGGHNAGIVSPPDHPRRSYQIGTHREGDRHLDPDTWQEHRIVDLTGHLGLAQSTVSAHLACLRDCGLIVSRPQGRASMFSLTHPELLDLLAERLLSATGDAVVLCPTYGEAAAR